MPSEHERHSRPNGCCEGIYSQPSRSQLDAAVIAEQQYPDIVPQGKRPPGKKDPNLCKAAHWKGPHQPELRLRQWGVTRNAKCGWTAVWSTREHCDVPGYACLHEEACAGCGKILRDRISREDCPHWRPITPELRAAIEVRIAKRQQEIAEWAARHRRQPKPPVTGPQGYRKKRSA